MGQWFNSTDDENQKPSQREVHENTSQDNLVTGGLYAVQEQENGPYQLAQVIYVEEQIVHVLCFAERLNQLPPQILQQNLTTGLNKEDSSFGIEHLPLPKADFAAHALF
ncbi:MAG: hypothetical protein D3909_15635, partial [Candidatus Electrothrix sp. ATG1]|nr:hypothetical protein [Candidatus Electrothrix sp. ATG1]